MGGRKLEGESQAQKKLESKESWRGEIQQECPEAQIGAASAVEDTCCRSLDRIAVGMVLHKEVYGGEIDGKVRNVFSQRLTVMGTKPHVEAQATGQQVQ